MPDGAEYFYAGCATWREIYARDLMADLWGPERIAAQEIVAMFDALPARCGLWREVAGTRPYDYDESGRLLRLIFESAEGTRNFHYQRAGAAEAFSKLDYMPSWEHQPKAEQPDVMTWENYAKFTAAFAGF